VLPLGGGYAWNVPGEPLLGGGAVPRGAAEDVAFLRRVVAALASRDCADVNRFYATGFSGGARLASQLGCDASTTFAAVAAVSGLRFPEPCRSARTVPMLAVHRLADPVDLYAGHGQAYWTYSVPEAARRWAAHDGCAARPATSRPAPGVTLTAYGRCRSGAAVRLYSVDGAGHAWPGGPRLPRPVLRLLGAQSSFDANAAIWRFLTPPACPDQDPSRTMAA